MKKVVQNGSSRANQRKEEEESFSEWHGLFH
jgi:hypothetical protein